MNTTRHAGRFMAITGASSFIRPFVDLLVEDFPQSFIVSDDAGFVTGQTMLVDGGEGHV